MLRRLLGDGAGLVGDPPFRVVLVASLISPLGTAVVSPVLAGLTGPLAVSEARVGLLLAVFTAPAVVLIPVAGALSDRVGRRPVLAAALALFGLAGSAVALVDSFRAVLALRFVQGVGYCGVAPVLITVVGDLYEGEREAAAQGLRFTVVGVSLTLAPLVAGALVALAWQAPFLVYLLALPASVAVALFLGEPRREPDDRGEPAESVVALVTRPRVAVALLGLAAPRLVWFAFLAHASAVVARLGGGGVAAGAVVAAGSVGLALSATQVGRLTAAAARGPVLAGGVVACAAGLAALPFAPAVSLAAAAAAVTGGGFGVAVSLYRSEMTRLAPARRRGGLVSVGESVGRVGSTVAPAATGAVVGAATPALGPAGATRAALVGVAAVAAVGGGGCALVAERLAPPPGSPAAGER